MKQIKLSTTIYEKEFQIKSLGYCCEEVDSFLDEINQEIVKLEREITLLTNKLNQAEVLKQGLENQVKDLNRKNLTLQANSTVTSTSTANFNNIELVNRISNLEKMVKEVLDKIKQN